MRKGFIALPLAAILQTAVLASCTYLQVKDGNLIQIGSNSYSISDIYNGQLDSSSAGKSFYTLLDNVYTQLAYQRSVDMDITVNDQVRKNYYDDTSTAAKNNGTSQKAEQEKVLAAANVDTLDEYRDSLYLAAQKDRANTAFYSDSNMNASLTPSYIEEDAPYHVKHILVKVDAANNEYHRGLIGEQDAKDIAAVVRRLAEKKGESFGDVAHSASEDDSSTDGSDSANNYGDLGIMDKNTSFVNEFKLGTYAYDMFFNNAVTDKEAVADTVGPSTDSQAAQLLYADGQPDYVLNAIPYTAAVALNQYSDKTSDDTGFDVKNAAEGNYPRNVIFNNYFNNHAVSLVYFDDVADLTDLFDIPASSAVYSSTASFLDTVAAPGANDYAYKTVAELGLSGKLMQYNYAVDLSAATAEGLYDPTDALVAVPDGKKVLTDEQGNPVLVTRAGSSSYEGIHFIVVQKDPFVSSLDELESYYTLNVSASSKADAPEDFVNYIRSDASSNYDKRADKIRTAVKATDSNMSFKLFADTKAKAEASYDISIPAAIEDTVNAYIDNTIASNDYTAQTSFDNSWKTYLTQLNVQRATAYKTVPTVGIKSFLNGTIQPYLVNTESGWIYSDTRPTTGEQGVDWVINPAFLKSSIGD